MVLQVTTIACPNGPSSYPPTALKTMEHPGLVSWANSIRLTMASDPGRQVFKDQVQTHGFMFLEDYLDNIVSGGKADPLIELVKTPGRKKAIARKPKLTFSKLANSTIFEEIISNENENLPPANSFQAASTKVQTQQVVVEGQKARKVPFASDPPMWEKTQRTPFASIQPTQTSSHTNPPLPIVSAQPIALQQPIEQSSAKQNDLSIIAEDDEPSERSRPSISNTVKPLETSIIGPEPVSEATPSLQTLALEFRQDTSQQDMDVTTTSSVDTFHSIPLNSPPRAPSEPIENPKPTTAILVDVADNKESSLEDPAEEPSELVPTSSTTEIKDYLMADTHEDTNQKISDKPVVPSFPSLPEPMPLRKSIRHPSINTVMQGAATPSAPVGGKRTSWLMKAREIKALEAPVKKPVVSAFTLNPTSVVPESHGTSIKRKSGDMLSENPTAAENGERHTKVAKLDEAEAAPRKSEHSQHDRAQQEPIAKNVLPQPESFQQDDPIQPEGVFDRLKKTVEGLGVRTSKTAGKSIGGAATALAEARAAAEARVAERDRKEEEMTMAMGLPSTKANFTVSPQDKISPISAPRQNKERLSISDLFPTDSRVKEKHKVPEKPFQFTPSFVPTSAKKAKEAAIPRDRTSTTPLHSPQPKNRTLPPAPVFNKPPPVFVPPVPAPASTLSSTSMFSSAFDAPSASKYTMSPSLALAFASRTASPSSISEEQKPSPLTAQSTVESVQSDIFDRNDNSAWVPSTQDTDYTDVYESQSQPQTQICDEDDSWPVDEKLAAGVQWSYGASKEDSMTWSTLPSQSQRADAGSMSKVSPVRETVEEQHGMGQASDPFDMDMDNDQDAGEDFERRDLELEDISMESSKATVALAEPKVPRSQSQMSMASSESSHSQSGFLTQASRLLNSALGKKKQPEVKKVLQMAASAAKKQQEEADKKAARLKEMENRRQVALQRKAEEEKAKALEEERKLKEESERRKKEREDMTDKRSLKPSTSKRDEEANKKRKVEPEKKQEIKKPALLGKSHLKTALKQPSTSNLNNSFAFGASAQQSAPAPPVESSSSLHKGKGVVQPPMDDEVSTPSQLVQSQMAARAKAQIDAAKQTVPLVASESIELPDINSEYSDSDDEDRPRTFDPPEWAQSPELRTALEMQSTINPDDIFGAVRPLKMEEIFKTRTSRFRARSSSANWTGTDRLTLQEEKDYARRMGFK